MNISDDDTFSFEDDVENVLTLNSQHNIYGGIRPFSQKNEHDHRNTNDISHSQQNKTNYSRISSSNIATQENTLNLMKA
jgi:hypothetical protein